MQLTEFRTETNQIAALLPMGQIATPGGSLQVDDGHVEWCLTPKDARPITIIKAVLRLLGAADRPADQGAGTFNRAVADGLAAAGMSAAMTFCTDEVAMAAFAGLAVTNPDRPDLGMVYVDDERDLTWLVDTANWSAVSAPELAATLTDVLTITGTMPTVS